MDINQILNDEPPPTNMHRHHNQDVRQPSNAPPHPIDSRQPYSGNQQHVPGPEFGSPSFYPSQPYMSADPRNPHQSQLRDQVAATHAVVQRAQGIFGTYAYQAAYSANTPGFNPPTPPFMPNFGEHISPNTDLQASGMNHSDHQPNLPPSSMYLPDLDVLDCGLCLESRTKQNFPYRCDMCSHVIYCADCLKDWFLDACKNESKMPPKCCQIIPLAVVSKLLKAAEVELYKAKYLEWSTVNRLYCPIPTCSVFIPPSQYIKKEKKKTLSLEAYRALSHDRGELVEAIGMPPQKESKRPVVACPECYTPVCTKCRSYNHLGNCKEKDLEPELENALQRWKIKRCPKCRAGVKKVYGCHHIECRCGAHFCYSCLRSINLCGGCVEGEDGQSGSEDGEQDVDTIDDDDLDGQADFYDGDGRNFGDEPDAISADSWSCYHYWGRVVKILRPSELGTEQRLIECHRCFRQVKAQLIKTDTLRVSSMSGRLGSLAPWQCGCGAQVCRTCPSDLPSSTTVDDSHQWTCLCSLAYCKVCEQNMMAEKENLEEDFGWTCRCGTIICGACKKEEYVDE